MTLPLGVRQLWIASPAVHRFVHRPLRPAKPYLSGSMNLTAWLIGDKAESILNDLTAPDGYPPAQIWIPLDRTLHYATKQLPRYRSAWAHRTTGTEQWVDFAAAADTIAEAVGPHALANPRSITLGKALLSNVQTRDGILMAKVPRYFSTVATDWTFDQVGQVRSTPAAAGRRRGRRSASST